MNNGQRIGSEFLDDIHFCLNQKQVLVATPFEVAAKGGNEYQENEDFQMHAIHVNCKQNLAGARQR